jgi:hypothetical protein
MTLEPTPAQSHRLAAGKTWKSNPTDPKLSCSEEAFADFRAARAQTVGLISGLTAEQLRRRTAPDLNWTVTSVR